jgi:hypothetical protein
MTFMKYVILTISCFLITSCGGGDDSSPAQPPVVNAGIDQSADEGVIITLVGSGSDADGSVTFSWSQTSGTAVTLSSTTISNPTFMAPIVTGSVELVFTLTVTDSAGNSVVDTVIITVVDFNASPNVDAGPDQTVDEGDAVSLNGSGSDAEGAVTYVWSQTVGTAVTLTDSTISDPNFTAPNVQSDEVLTFTLTVTDEGGKSKADSVAITVQDTDNTLPIVNAGIDQQVDEGAAVLLAGSGSDAEGSVTLSWTQISGTTVTLSDNSVANPSFTAPLISIDETLTFRLTVTDNVGASVFDDVSIVTKDNNSPSSSLSLSYLFYSNSLNAVDPSSPAASILIEPTANLVQKSAGLSATAEKIQWGNLDSSSKVLTDWHTHAVIFPSTDGRIYQVSALLTGSLTPVQVSNEAQADQICTSVIGGAAVRLDFDNVDNSTYLYVLPGADAFCDTNDDVWKIVRLGMSMTDDPIVAKKFVSELTDINNGAISGWLVHDAGELQRCDADFANCITLSTVSDSAKWRLNSTFENILLDINGKLHIYSKVTNTLSPPRFSVPTGTYNSVADSDGTTIYFANDNILYQMPADGSADATVLHTEINDIQRVVAGNNTVVFQQSINSLGVEIKSIAKSGGSPISLATRDNDNDILLLYVQEGKVYYNERIFSVAPEFTITPIIAGVINEDGTGLSETADSVWFGGKLKTTFNLALGFRVSELLENIFLLEGFDIAGTAGGFAGSTIKVVDPATATVDTTLGDLPTTDKILDFQCLGFGDDQLCSTLIEIDITPAPTIPFQNDVFFINSSISDSLIRVTDTIDETEAVLY